MPSLDTTERRVIASLLTFNAAVVAIGNALFFFTQGRAYLSPYIVLQTLSLVLAPLLYWRGYDWARLLAVVCLTVTTAGFMPEPYLSQDFAVAILLPVAFTLVVADARWVVGSAVATYAILLARGGPDSVYLEPGGLLVTILIVGGMAMTRQVTDAARARAEEQARLLDEERQLLEQRVAERTQSLAEANAELREASAHKDLFLAGLSHELRTPLNIILGNAELLREGIYGPLAERQIRSLNTVAESGEHLLQLINDLLDMARLRAGAFSIDQMEVSINDLCVQCGRMFRSEVERKRLSLQIDLDPQASHILGDPQRLRQILINLLSNAVKFTPAGGQVTLSAQRVDQEQQVELAVSDTGIGIAAEHLGKLFQPFGQIDRRLSRQYEGTGLGLALVAQLTSLHGGSVGVTSTPDVGSRFWVRLPTLARGLDQTPAHDTTAGQ